MSIKEYIDYANVAYQWLLRRYYSGLGLLGQFVIAIIIINEGYHHFKDQDNTVNYLLGKLFGTTHGILICKACTYVITFLCVFTIWLLKRRVPRFSQKEVGILFGPSHSSDVRSDLLNLKDRLAKEIKSKDYVSLMKVKELPPNRRILSHKEAVSILERSRAKVLIWGSFERNSSQGKEVTGFTEISITWQFKRFDPQQIHRAVTDAAQGRQWNWDASNTIDQIVVADNISELTRYIVCISLAAQNKLEEATNIALPLHAEATAKYDHAACSLPMRRFKAHVSALLAYLLIESVNQPYLIALYKEELNTIDGPKCQSAIYRIEQGLALNDRNVNGWMSLAVFCFLAGDVAKARDAIQKARGILPRSKQMGCDLSEAFLFCYEGKYRDAKKIYKRVFQSPESRDIDVLNSVFFFVQQMIPRFPDRLQIRFVYGMLNDELGNKLIALEELKEFTSISKGHADLDRWRKEAEHRVEDISRHIAASETQSVIA